MYNIEKIVNAALKFLERRLNLVSTSITTAIESLQKTNENQTRAISVLAQKVGVAQKPPVVNVDMDLSVVETALAAIGSKIPKGQSVDLKNVEGALMMIISTLKENSQSMAYQETVDAFGKSMKELKPKDTVKIDSRQMQALMAAVTNSGAPDAPNGGLYSGRQVVAAAGTAVQLQAEKERCENMTITAESDNTGLISVGDSSVVAAEGSQQGAILTPLGSITVKVGDLSKIYIDSTVSGDGVTFAYER